MKVKYDSICPDTFKGIEFDTFGVSEVAGFVNFGTVVIPKKIEDGGKTLNA